MNRDLSVIHPIDFDADTEIQEFVGHSWYKYSQGDDKGLHPFKGETDLNFTGPMPPYEHLDVDKKYSWIKSPRWNGKAMEVGPLARVLMMYAGGNAQAKELVDSTLKTLDVPVTALYSTLGRTAARTLESKILADSMQGMFDSIDGQYQGRGCPDLQRPILGSIHLAEIHAWRWPDGSATWRTVALDRHR